MARAILDIAQEAAERDNTCPPPATLFGTNDRIARITRQALKDTMRDIMRRSEDRGLSDVKSLWALVLQPGVFTYQLPPDYLRMIPNTETRGGMPLSLLGPASSQSWSAFIAGAAAMPVMGMTWTIGNGVITFAPTPSAQELVVIQYISKYMVVSPIMPGDYDAGTPPNAIPPTVPREGFIDGDAPEVVYEQQSDFEYGTAPGFDAGLWTAEFSEILRRINPLATTGPAPMVRREEFTTDADKPAFEDDYVLSLGLTYRMRRGLGLDYAEQAAEFEEELSMKLGTDAGSARAFTIGRNAPDCEIAPLGNGQWLVR